jgi:hypothetical protein
MCPKQHRGGHHHHKPFVVGVKHISGFGTRQRQEQQRQKKQLQQQQQKQQLQLQLQPPRRGSRHQFCILHQKTSEF